MKTRQGMVEERAMGVARWAVEKGFWTMQTASEFVRVTRTEEQVRFWEQAVETQG